MQNELGYLETMKIIYGYKKFDNSFLNNDNFKSCLNTLNNCNFNMAKSIYKKMIPLIAKETLDILFPNLDKYIYMIPSDILLRIYNEFTPIDENSIVAFANKVSKIKSKIKVHNLPISYQSGNSMEGKVNKLIIYCKNIELLKKYKIIFSGIILGSDFNYLSPFILIHEQIHSLLERNKGVIENYYNSELLPILMESIGAYTHNNILADLIIKNRLYLCEHDKKKLQKEKDDLKVNKYLNSSFLAYYLFDIYISYNRLIKNEMLEKIEKVLDGSLQLEEFLKLYDATYENSQIPIVLKKYIN